MGNNHKYVLLGDAQSPHLIKWIKELHNYFNLYVLTFRTCNPEVYQYVDKNKCYEFNVPINQDGGNFHILKLYFKIKKILSQIEPEVIHAHYITSYGFLASLCASSNYYLILSAWGTDILKTPYESWFKKMITKYAIRKSHMITSDSIYMSQKILELNKNAKVTTFPLGLSFLPEASFEDKIPFMFFSNRALTKNYRIDKVLKCFSIIKNNNPDALLVIANKGDEEANLRAIADKLNISNSIQWVGYLSEQEQAAYYKKAQYFFSLPESDATSVSLLEAMAYGCVPIVSDIPANYEWVEHKKNGIILSENVNIIDELNSLIPSLVFDINRKIIKERAIFHDLVREFVQTVKGELL